MREDVYQRITDRIVEQLEQGTRPWIRPWNADHAAGRIMRPLRANGVPYRGINTIMLWSEATTKGFAAPYWMTFRQAKELGAYPRKREHGSLVVYAATVTRTETDETTGEASERDIPFMKGYHVFNVEQIEGLPTHYFPEAAPTPDDVPRIAKADAFFTATDAAIRHSGNRAFYCAGSDHVQMPPIEVFRDAVSYYATLAHEITHWTKHPARLDRDLGRKRWGDAGYAMEELVAELGAAFLCADLDLTPEVREEHASYVASWIKVLQDDTRAIFTAAALAQKAVDFLGRLQTQSLSAAA